MTAVDVYGLGHALVDVVAPVRDEVFSKFSFPQGSTMRLSFEQQNDVIKVAQIKEGDVELYSSGAVANTLATVSQLAGKAVLACRIGDDDMGEFYRKDLGALSVRIGNAAVAGATTGKALVLLAPDGKRTTGINFGTSSDINPMDLDPAVIRQSRWILLEGFLLDNGRYSMDAVEGALNYVKTLSAAERPRVAVSLCSRYLVKKCRNSLVKVIAESDLVFGTMHEVFELTGVSSESQAFQKLERLAPNFVFCAGKGGAYFSYDRQYGHIPAIASSADAAPGMAGVFAGAFLYGITNGHTVPESVRGANYLASRLNGQKAPRLTGDVKRAWKEGLVKG